MRSLRSNPLFAAVPSRTLSSVTPPPRHVILRGGETLFHQGEAGTAYYAVIRGRLGVFLVDEQGSERRIGEVVPGEGVGEMALLSDEPRAATVRAVRDSQLVALSRSSFLDLVGRVPEVALGVTRTVVDRLRATLVNRGHGSPLSTVAVLGLDDDVDAEATASALADSFAGQGDCCVASPTGGGPARRLDELEATHDAVVLFGAAEDAAAARRVAGQADVVLLLASGVADAATIHRTARQAAGLDLPPWVRRYLVLRWQTAAPLPGHARLWRDALPSDGAFHLRDPVPADVDRLARHLNASEVAVVLSGGAARGFAHIGMLRALDEAGVPVDRLGGASMGALIAAQRAMELDADEQVAVCRHIWVQGRPLRDYTFPSVAVVRGRRLQGLIREALGEVDIEDLPLPFFSVASNLGTAQVRVDERGSLWRAVRASGSVPGYGPPMFTGGEALIDGGVLANLPVGAMRDRATGPIVAVDVSQEDFPPFPSDLDDATPSGWTLLRRLRALRRDGLPTPGFGRILYRTATLAGVQAAREARDQADFVLLPPVAAIGPLEFARIDELVELGYTATSKQLAARPEGVAALRPGPTGRAARVRLTLD